MKATPINIHDEIVNLKDISKRTFTLCCTKLLLSVLQLKIPPLLATTFRTEVFPSVVESWGSSISWSLWVVVVVVVVVVGSSS